MNRSILLLALTVALTACGGEISSARDAAVGVTAEIRNETLVVRNHMGKTICYFPIEADYAARAQFILPADAASCDKVGAGRGLTIALDDIAGWNAEARNVIFYWWFPVATSTPTTVAAESFRVLVVSR